MRDDVLGMLFCSAIAILLIASLIVPKRRARAERGLEPRFEAKCGVLVATFPGAELKVIRLSVYEDFLVIAQWWPRVIPNSDVQRIEVTQTLFGRKLLRIQLQFGDFYDLRMDNPEEAATAIRESTRPKPGPIVVGPVNPS